MTMPPCGTFRYSLVLPPDIHSQKAPWPMRMDEEIPAHGNDLFTSRLLGYAPCLVTADSGSTAPRRFEIPDLHTTHLNLIAQTKKNAQVHKISLFVSHGLFSALLCGDELHLARTPCAGLGLSVTRSGCLALAAGAVTAVPLGQGIKASFHDRRHWIENEFKHFSFREEGSEQAIEVTAGDQSFTGCTGHTRLGDYELSVVHGYRVSTPGDDECVAITRTGTCSLQDAEISARLLDCRDIAILQW